MKNEELRMDGDYDFFILNSSFEILHSTVSLRRRVRKAARMSVSLDRSHESAGVVSQIQRESAMAQYKYRDFLTESKSVAFDTRYAPGTRAENPGIYRCTVCNEEIAAAKGRLFPDATHHTHDTGGETRWQMIVFAQQNR